MSITITGVLFFLLIFFFLSPVSFTYYQDYSSPAEVFINEITNVKKEAKLLKESAYYEHTRHFTQTVFYKQATWVKRPLQMNKGPFWLRWLKNLLNVIWQGSGGWENRKLIHTTDGQIRYKWSVNFSGFHDDIANLSGGRIRLVDGDIYIKAAEVEDTGIYTCLEISEQGIYIHHTHFIVIHFRHGMLDFDNPIVLFKWALIGVMNAFVLIAAYQFTKFDQNKAMAFAERMEPIITSAAKEDMLQANKQRAIEFQLYGHAKMVQPRNGLKRADGKSVPYLYNVHV